MTKKMLLGLALATGLSIVAVPAINLLADDKPAAGKDAAAKAPEGFESLFNGKDLTGWKGREDIWKVEDGAITGDAKQDPGYNTFLVWQGGDVADFELHFKYRIHSGNSGVQYRSKVLDPAKFTVGGYQGDFEHGTTYSGILYDEGGVAGYQAEIADLAGKDGFLYHEQGEKTRGYPEKSRYLCYVGDKVTIDEAGKSASVGKLADNAALAATYRKGDWNDYVIIARGNTIEHFLNGYQTVEAVDNDPKNGPKSGVIALQLHQGPPMKIEFRDIRLKAFTQSE